MCDFDSHPSFSTFKLVKSRVEHRCRQCRVVFEKGTKIFCWKIGWDGTARTLYVCQVCEFMSRVVEESPFHICLDTAGSDPMRATDPAYQEVQSAFAEGRTPDPSRVPLRVY